MTEKQGLAELGEFGLIERIQRQAGTAPYLRLGIGDDCSVQTVGSEEELLTSTDLLIEGVHFDLSWTDFEQLGRKCVAVNVSDIAAMGGCPKSLHLGVAVPPALPVENLERFVAGFLAEARRYEAVLAGGDTCRSGGPLMIAVTVQGTVRQGQAVRRSGAESGDLIFVSGALGDSALALRQWQAGREPDPELAQRHHCPPARTRLGRRLAERKLAHAMIDISDGLLADLGHILAASGRGATLNLEKIPLSALFSDACRKRPELFDLALTGGEDYELLFCAPPAAETEILLLAEQLRLPLTRIGSVSERPGLQVVRADGSRYQPRQGGFDHFAQGTGG